MKAIACPCKNFRHGSPTCQGKERSELNRVLSVPVVSLSSWVLKKPHRFLVLSVQILIVMSVCVGSGSINIPVLCMLVSGDAKLLEVLILLNVGWLSVKLLVLK